MKTTGSVQGDIGRLVRLEIILEKKYKDMVAKQTDTKPWDKTLEKWHRHLKSLGMEIETFGVRPRHESGIGVCDPATKFHREPCRIHVPEDPLLVGYWLERKPTRL